MTWIALVGPEIEENLSLRYIASSLAESGYPSEIIPFNHDGDFAAAITAVVDADTPPLIVGISLAFQWRARDFLAYAMALRDAGYRGHITMGGHFATFASDDILADYPEIDSVVRQEAEETMVKLAIAIEKNLSLEAISGLAFRKGDVVVRTEHPVLPDLAKIPRPDRRGEPAACFGHGIAPLVSSRGCYANCTFCCIAAWQEQSLPGKRYRLREVADVADEMVELQKTRGIDIFVFHDDNFFVPGHKRNRERLSALADALDARKIGHFATVVKARPTDVDPEVFRILKERLNCIRVYIGIETDADQGLKTLKRWSHSKQNHSAIEVVRKLDLYTCFNMLVFDPDTDVDALETNIRFMRFAPEYPSNFGRVELYAGTPLLARMQQEGRVVGDYMQWDYDLANPRIERIFQLSMEAFHHRNFGGDALANRLMGTRFDVEVCRHFHKDVFRPEWLDEGKDLNRALSINTADGLQEIVDHVKRYETTEKDGDFVAELAARLRAFEDDVGGRARDLATRIHHVIGIGRPLTEIGDKVATPLQRMMFLDAASGAE
jgi:anaerobic magnesium-protoporphyrin IX monomethyl ester cyclase